MTTQAASKHRLYMQRAISLALKGKGWVHPNPLVGCVLVKNGRVIAEGYHGRFGGPHAEQVALAKAGSAARGSTAYVNLEPCVHWGKTPPCAPALVSAGVREVHVAIKDPNPKVSGRGISFLRRSGIRVLVGTEKEAAAHLNRSFLTWMATGRPYVILKMAMTLDGKIATRSGDSKWVSSASSRQLVHRLRADSDAVLVGATTAQNDNPELTSHGKGRNPVRIVLDPQLRTSPRLKLYRPASTPTWLISTKRHHAREAALQKSGHELVKVDQKKGSINLKIFLNYLGKHSVSQLLVEGGGETAWRFISNKLVDEIYWFIAPKIAGGREAVTPVEGSGFAKMMQALALKSYSVARLGPDIVIKGSLK